MGLSVIFSGTYYFSYNTIQSAVATYSFSFGFLTEEFEHYWIHSHWKLQTAISKALQIGTPSLVILDEVTDAQKTGHDYSMHIEGRILDNPSTVKSKLNILENDLKIDELKGAMTEIGQTLLQVMRNEFSLKQTTDDVKIINLRIQNIENGERLFELNADDSTLKNICCWRCSSTNRRINAMEFPDYKNGDDIGYDSENHVDGDTNERNGIYVAEGTSTVQTVQSTTSNRAIRALPMVSIHENHH